MLTEIFVVAKSAVQTYNDSEVIKARHFYNSEVKRINQEAKAKIKEAKENFHELIKLKMKQYVEFNKAEIERKKEERLYNALAKIKARQQAVNNA